MKKLFLASILCLFSGNAIAARLNANSAGGASGGGGGSGSLNVEDGGAAVVTTSTLNFTGAQFIVTDDSGEALVKIDPSSGTLQGNSVLIASHASRHQDSGSDEISVTSLSGLLADPQQIVISTAAVFVASTTRINFVAGSNASVSATTHASSITITYAASASGGSGGGGYALEPATVTITASKGIATTTMTFTDGFVQKADQYTAGAGLCMNTGGCTNAAQFQTATSSVNYAAAVFTNATTQYWEIQVPLPDNFATTSTMTFQVIWTSTGTTSAVSWYVECRAVSDDDAIDGAYGTAVEIVDTNLGNEDLMKSPESAAVTCAGSPVGGDDLFIGLYRNVSDASDTWEGDARFVRLRMSYLIDNISARD